MSDAPISPDLLDDDRRHDWLAWVLAILAVLSIAGFVWMMSWLRGLAATPDRFILRDHAGPVVVALFDAAGRSLLTASTGGADLQLHDTTAPRGGGAPPRRLRAEPPLVVTGLAGGARSADGATLLTWSPQGEPTLWDVRRGLALADATASLRAALAAGGREGAVPADGAPPAPAPFRVAGAALAADGARVALAARDGRVALAATASGAVERLLETAAAEAPRLALTADATRLATSGGSGAGASVFVWEIGADAATSAAATSAPAFALAAPAGGVTALAWSPDARRLAVAGGDGGVALFELPRGTDPRSGEAGDPRAGAGGGAGEASDATASADASRPAPGRPAPAAAPPVRFAGHTAPVAALAWSPDGRLVASRPATKDPLVVWEAATGAVRGRFAVAGTPPESASMAFDGAGVVRVASRGFAPHEAYVYHLVIEGGK